MNQVKKVNSTKPTSVVSRKVVKAPAAYRPQPTPKCLQLKASPGMVMDQPSVKKAGPTPPPVYRPQPVPKVLQRKMASVQSSNPLSLRVPASRVVQRMEARAMRQQKAVENMVWDEAVVITMPAPKHILEKMNLIDANGKKKISVVELAVAQKAVEAIGKHVKAYGWKSHDDITIEKSEDGTCWAVTYEGNVWKTHSNSGQIWPLKGPDIFSPPEDNEDDMRPYIRKWKGNKQNRPPIYMDQK